MPFTDPECNALVAAITSAAQKLGIFDKVTGHEPKSAPASGLTCSYFMDFFGPVSARSGLDRTCMMLVYQARVLTSMLAEPADEIDPSILKATSGLILAYHGDFDLGIDGLELDLLGAYWQGGLAARAGYVTIGSTQYRGMIISIPIIINDAYLQVR